VFGGGDDISSLASDSGEQNHLYFRDTTFSSYHATKIKLVYQLLSSFSEELCSSAIVSQRRQRRTKRQRRRLSSSQAARSEIDTLFEEDEDFSALSEARLRLLDDLSASRLSPASSRSSLSSEASFSAAVSTFDWFNDYPVLVNENTGEEYLSIYGRNIPLIAVSVSDSDAYAATDTASDATSLSSVDRSREEAKKELYEEYREQEKEIRQLLAALASYLPQEEAKGKDIERINALISELQSSLKLLKERIDCLIDGPTNAEEGEAEEEEAFHERRILASTQPSIGQFSSLINIQPDIVISGGTAIFENPNYQETYHVFYGDFSSYNSVAKNGVDTSSAPSYPCKSAMVGYINTESLMITVLQAELTIDVPILAPTMYVKQLNVFNGTVFFRNDITVTNVSFLYESSKKELTLVVSLVVILSLYGSSFSLLVLVIFAS
jgi:hypothetical protein